MNFRAVLIAVVQTMALFSAGLVIPLLGQALGLFTPVPVILASLRAGRREGMAAVAVSTALCALLGWETSLVYVVSFGLMSLAIAEGMLRAMKPERIALLGGLLPLAVVAPVVAVYFIRVGKNPFEYADALLRSNISEAAKLYAGMGLKEAASLINSVPDKFIYYFVRLAPGITTAISVLQAACCYGMARAVLARRQVPAPAGISFAVWHAPDSWVWGLIASLVLLIVTGEPARLAGWNLAIVFALVYLTQGTAIVEFYLRKIRIRPVMRGIIIGLLLALPALVFIIALGIVDIWADVRKVRGPAP
ncbi:MAG TPA: DUF2232 domain-containing protein [Nitrospirota bacterium]|nr:DUF2232 domain-containing protein [Nitrospirota bacterium]